MLPTVAPRDVERFYRAAAVGLSVLESRSGGGRRFGADADARWKSFRGGLGDWHRLDLLVRDAAVRHPAGFAPRVVFDLPALAEDEPCGPDWPGPEPTEASELLRSAATDPKGIAPALQFAAAAWGLDTRPLAPDALTGIGPATRLIVAGAGAVLSLASVFATSAELDLGDQASLVCDDAGTRQLFGLALAAVGSMRPARIFRPEVSVETARSAGLTAADRVLVSEDAAPGVREQALAIGRALGARG